MDVRLYEPSELPDRDIFLDFADVFESMLPASELAREPEKNSSLDSFTLAFLRAINRYVPYKSGDLMSELRGNLHGLVETFASGPPFEGEIEVIDAVNAAVAQSNEAVRRMYFSERPPPLFRPTVGAATASLKEPEIPDDVVRLVAFLWEAKQRQVLQLKQRLDKRGLATDPRAGPPQDSNPALDQFRA